MSEKANPGPGFFSRLKLRGSPTLTASITILLILFLAAESAFLYVQNRRYEETLMQLGLLKNPDMLKTGETIGDLAVTTLEGTPATLDIASGRGEYVLFVLSTSCPYCLANLGKWGEISRRISGSGRYVVGVSVHGPAETTEYVRENKVGFYTVAVADSGFMGRYRIPGVPATVLLSAGGTVEGVWIGELTEKDVADVIHHAL